MPAVYRAHKNSELLACLNGTVLRVVSEVGWNFSSCFQIVFIFGNKYQLLECAKFILTSFAVFYHLVVNSMYAMNADIEYFPNDSTLVTADCDSVSYFFEIMKAIMIPELHSSLPIFIDILF